MVTPPKESTDLHSIQALRAIAALSVVLVHIDFMHVGGFGVDIFFVISGFIICYVVTINPAHFLPKRAFRILPLYWFGTLGVFAIALAQPQLLGGTTANATNLVKSMLMVPYQRPDGNVFPVLFLGWTLEYEVFFYAVFGVALRWFGQRAPLAASAFLIAVAAAGFGVGRSPTALWFYTSPVIIEFAFGIAVYSLWRRTRVFASVPVPAAMLVAVCSGALLVVGSASVTRLNRPLLAGVPALVLVLAVLSLEGRVRFPKWLLLIGDVSYSLYLFHPYVIQLVDRKAVSMATLSLASFAAAVVAILTSCLVAYASFRLVERPSNTFLRRTFLPKRSTPPRAYATAV